MVATSKNPKMITLYGRLSFPTFTAKEAYDLGLRGNYPAKDVASASPSFTLLVDMPQWERFITHATEVFLPYCAEQAKKGEKKDALEDKEVKLLIDGITGDLADQVYNTPAKAVSEKSVDLVPTAVAAIKCIGQKGVDLDKRAIVQDESEMRAPDPHQLDYPCVKPIGLTKHELYAGCYAAATLNLYAYRNGKLPGFSAGVSTIVFKMDGDRIGGSVAVDESAIFLD